MAVFAISMIEKTFYQYTARLRCPSAITAVPPMHSQNSIMVRVVLMAEIKGPDSPVGRQQLKPTGIIAKLSMSDVSGVLGETVLKWLKMASMTRAMTCGHMS